MIERKICDWSGLAANSAVGALVQVFSSANEKELEDLFRACVLQEYVFTKKLNPISVPILLTAELDASRQSLEGFISGSVGDDLKVQSERISAASHWFVANVGEQTDVNSSTVERDSHQDQLSFVYRLLKSAHHYLQDRLDGQIPEAPDWQQKERDYLTKISEQGEGTELKVDLKSGELTLVRASLVLLEMKIIILGVYQAPGTSYLAGWAHPRVPREARPMPVMGLPSTVKDLTEDQALEEARKSGAQLGVEHVLSMPSGDSSFMYLGILSVGVPTAAREVRGVRSSDLGNDVKARLAKLSDGLETLNPRSFDELCQRHSGEISNRSKTFPKDSSSRNKLLNLGTAVSTLADGLSEKNAFGLKRSTVSKSEQKEVSSKLQDLERLWSDGDRLYKLWMEEAGGDVCDLFWEEQETNPFWGQRATSVRRARFARRIGLAGFSYHGFILRHNLNQLMHEFEPAERRDFGELGLYASRHAGRFEGDKLTKVGAASSLWCLELYQKDAFEVRELDEPSAQLHMFIHQIVEANG